ncbi:hypothetical protein Taro_044112 [Colocasia esculenta]|uniref:Aminotransferase-like plant mobile domain-containing protein n=1 Tax=Colocasia esculenta TaxID=4460 RepID=A0A843WT61_COLES|nr:hypothetical protein [Colocasia esculenta]
MPRSTKHRGESSRASRRSEGDVQRTEDPMPYFTLSPARADDPERLDKGLKVCALGPLEESSPLEGVVDMRRVDRTERGYRYRRGGDYSGHFPLDEHLFPFIQSFVPVNWEGPDGLLLSERAQLERAILVGRDSLMGTCSFHYPSFPVDYTAQAHFPEAGQLGLFSAEPVNRVRELMLAQGLWEVHKLPKTGPTFTGRIPLPSGPEFVSEGYDRSCFLDRIMSKEAAGWYDRWSVISSHRFRFGATEWLMGILYHYRQLLDQVGLLHAVVAALYSYPCHTGLLQALAERFNRRFNTFCVADGETCLDLWALHSISGLPISGHFYEEVCLNDLLRDQSTGAGSYVLSHSFRYLMKVWRDLARYVPGGVSAGEGTSHRAVSTPSLQEIHSLLVSGLGGELPDFSDFAPGLLEGGTLPRASHCAMTITSSAALPVRSPREEGEVLERTVSPGRRGVSHLTRAFILFAGGAEIVAEMMEMGPSVAVFSSAATQAGVEGAPHGAVTAPLLSVAGESLTAAGGDVPLPPFAAASPVRPAPFPSHGVLWPSEPQGIQMADKGGVLETLMGLVRSAMEESSPPCLERVRGFLYRNTRAYHLMGFPRDPWMAAVDAVWDEVQQRCQEATRLKIQELSAEVTLEEQRFEALRSQRGDVLSRVETLRAGCAQCHADIIGFQRTIKEASKCLADRQAAYQALTEGAAEAEAAATALEQEFADSQTRLLALQASLADLRGGPHASSARGRTLGQSIMGSPIWI